MATKNTNKGGIVAKQKEYSIATHKIPKFKSNQPLINNGTS